METLAYMLKGIAIIEIRSIGYDAVVQKVTITDAKTCDLDITLGLNTLLTRLLRL